MLPALLLLPFLVAVEGKSQHRQLSVSVAAGEDECFFFPDIKLGQQIEFEFQVTDTNSVTGSNEIDVQVLGPPSTEVVREQTSRGSVSWSLMYEAEGEAEGQLLETVEVAGTHQVCLDNTDSSWAQKVVWFEVTIHDPEDDYYDYDYGFDSEEFKDMKGRNEDTEALYEVKIENIKKSLHDVRINLGKAKHVQFLMSSDMSRDVHHGLANLQHIDLWALAHLAIVLLVGVSQVYIVRQLFEDKSLLRRLISMNP